MEEQEQIVMGAEESAAPVSDEGASSASVEGQDQNGLPPNMQEAFAKRLGAERAKIEKTIRTELEAEYAQRMVQQAPPAEVDDAAELAQINEQLLNEFYDKPLEAIQKAQQILAERQAARQKAEQERWNFQAAQLQKKYSDWEAVRPKMTDLLKQHPDLAERPEHLERVYNLAKQFTPANPDALLKDPAFLEKVKPVLRDQIVAEYVNGKREQTKTAPPVMGSSPGGTAPAAPPSTPRTFEEAYKSALERLGR